MSETAEATPEDIDVELEELIDVEEEDLAFSPLNFILCPRGPAKPKVSRQGTALMMRKQEESNNETKAHKKKRGCWFNKQKEE